MTLNDSDSDISFACFHQTSSNAESDGVDTSSDEGKSSSNGSISTFSDEIDDNPPDGRILLQYIPTIIDAGVVVARAALAACEHYMMIVDEEDEVNTWGGSKKGKAPNKKRNFEESYNNLIRDYFNEDQSVYNEADFTRRFRVSRNIFHRIYNKILNKGMFQQRKDAIGKPGIHPLVRVVACMRHLAYGDSFDGTDEYLRLSESSMSDSIKAFTYLIKLNFGDEYLNRCPTQLEREKMLQLNSKRGFPGMFASWDCSHFKWEKCPIRLHGQFKYRNGNQKTINLEALVDYHLRIWFCNFGNAGSLNDINVLDKSTIVGSIIDGSFDISVEPYLINGVFRDYMYFLVDGIYPEWSIFINSVNGLETEMEKLFSKQQEGARKDVERVFSVLCDKFQILKRTFRGWDIGDINATVECCIILHNMVVEENVAKGEHNNMMVVSDGYSIEEPLISIFTKENDASVEDMISTLNKNITDVPMNQNLKRDIVNHMWQNRNKITLYNNKKNNVEELDDLEQAV
jgi:hypothetical protein